MWTRCLVAGRDGMGMAPGDGGLAPPRRIGIVEGSTGIR